MRFAWLPLLIAVSATRTEAGVTTQEKYTYYDVSGNTASEIRTSINKTRFALGKRFDALTTWHIRWQFRHVPTQRKCKITEVNIDATIEYLLPRWSEADTHHNQRLVADWRDYIEQLTAHENEHGKLTKHAVSNLEQVIFAANDSADAPGDCKSLETRANNAARHEVEALKRRHRAFDLNTDHGRKSGATFP